MNKDKSEKYFILSAILGGCILISYLVFVIVRNGTHDIAFASICFAVVAIALCGGTFHIFNKLYNIVPKSERERINAEKLAEEQAEEARKKQLAEVQSREVSHPEPQQSQQPQIIVQNTIVNQNEIVNEVNTEVVNNVVNDITNNNVNIAEASADSSSASIASSEAEADAYAESHPTEKARPKESAATDSPAEESTDEQGQASEEILTVEPCDAAATYLAGIRYHEKKQAADARMKLVAIENYVRFIMSPYIEDKYMDDLWKELRAFAENPKCKPTPFTQFKVMLSTFDVKHLVWNIATRLGYGKGKPYNSENCAVFIKALFPTVCQYNGVPMDISSLQNLTATSPNEKIHLDYPDPERFGFHIPGQLGEEKE